MLVKSWKLLCYLGICRSQQFNPLLFAYTTMRLSTVNSPTSMVRLMYLFFVPATF